MSSIERLTISGVRAFAPGQVEKIDFGTPLTLIVGHNGSGKTTIIESLKYATAGIMPPTSKSPAQMASFLHDPHLDHERDTVAQLKVRIRTANGATVTGTRNMQVALSKGKLSFSQTLGSVLVQRGSEEPMASSVTRANLDAQLPAWLGVTPAVLDRVIFCHQDESLWPMSASKELKGYFDALFEIEKYAKAITELNNLRNKQKTSLERYKESERLYKEAKNAGAEAQKRMRKLSTDVATLSTNIKELDEQIKDLKVKMSAAAEKRDGAGLIVAELVGTRMKAKIKRETLDDLRQNLEELEDDTETLQRMAAQYEERTRQYKESSEQSKAHIQSLEKGLHQAGRELDREQRQLSEYEAQRISHEQELRRRKTLIHEVANRHDIRGFTGDITDHQVQAFKDRITRMAREQRAAVELAKQESTAEIDDIQIALNNMNERRATLTAGKNSAKKLVEDNERKIDRVQREHDNIEVDEGTISVKEDQLADLETRLAGAKQSMQEAGYEDAENRTTIELETMQSARKNLQAEDNKARDNLKETTRLDNLKTELSERQQRLREMVSAHKAKLNAIIGDSWQPSNVKQRFDSRLDTVNATVNTAQKERDTVDRELQQIDIKLSTVQTKIKQGDGIVKSAAQTISRVVVAGPAGYHDEVDELENTRDTIKGDADSFLVMTKYLDQCIKDAQTHKACRACTRTLKEKDFEAFMRSMEREKKKFDLASANIDLAKVEEDLRDIRSVAADVEKWERLTGIELPELRKELNECQQQRALIIQRLEAEDEKVSERNDAKREIEALSKTVTTIAALHTEIVNKEDGVKDSMAKLAQVGMIRDADSIKNDLDQNDQAAAALRIKLKKISDEKSRAKEAINSLELNIRDARSAVADVQRKLKDRDLKEREINELKAINTSQRTTIKDYDQTLREVQTELGTAQEKYDDARSRAQERDARLQDVASKVNNSLNQLEAAQQNIQEYIDNDGPALLARSQATVEKFKGQIHKLDKERLDITAELQQVEKLLSTHSETKRNIDENLRFRRDTELLKQIENSISELESHDAEIERDQYEDEWQMWNVNHQALLLDQSAKLGQVARVNEELKASLDNWKRNYKDAAKNYREAHINVEVTQACIKDLGQYSKALDQAIMKFHSIKMDEINRIIDDLWRKTYQGTDVDTIFIESDAEGASNKNYNYRVCMQKGATVMDMRGRCSAGQKVLACIIIRLALAECFGVNCGLIALDEPTTNLDTDNAQALAVALSELIRARKAQKNFQIIIITHDEEFLKYMSPANYVDYYYRVSRTSKQKSHIEREQISYLMRH